MRLLEFGTAYEALPDVLKVLEDDHAEQQSRIDVLDMLQKAIYWNDHWSDGKIDLLARMTIAVQADYKLPPALYKQLLADLHKLGDGADQELAVRAKAILVKAQVK